MDEIKCSICLDKITDKDITKETQCKHSFHLDCLKTWIQTNNNNLSCTECHLSRFCYNYNKNCNIRYKCPLCRQYNNIELIKNYKLLSVNELEKLTIFNIKNNIHSDVNFILKKFHL